MQITNLAHSMIYTWDWFELSRKIKAKVEIFDPGMCERANTRTLLDCSRTGKIIWKVREDCSINFKHTFIKQLPVTTRRLSLKANHRHLLRTFHSTFFSFKLHNCDQHQSCSAGLQICVVDDDGLSIKLILWTANATKTSRFKLCQTQALKTFTTNKAHLTVGIDYCCRCNEMELLHNCWFFLLSSWHSIKVSA